MICVFQWIQQKCSNLDVVYSVEVHTISMTSYRVILRLNLYEKSNWGSAFYSVVADPIIFSTTNKLFDNNIVTAWQQLLKINWGVRKLLEKIGVRQGSAGSAGVRRGPQNNWTPFKSQIYQKFKVQSLKLPKMTFLNHLNMSKFDFT